MNQPLNKYSSRITQPKVQGASQAMLYATGMTPEDMDKAQVGIASVWYEGNSCNMHLLDLAGEVKQGVSEAGLVGSEWGQALLQSESFNKKLRDLIQKHDLEGLNKEPAPK